MGFAASVPCVTPVPESARLKSGLAPSEVILTLPLAAPLVFGEKSTVNDALWPAFNVNGKVSPLRLNPVPLAVAAEMVRLDPPEFVRDPVSDFEAATWMFPKLKLGGFDPNWPGATPIPASGTESVGLFALELIVSAPLAAPAVEGVKITLKVVPCPALSVIGRLGPVTLNPLPLAAALDKVTPAPPVLVTVMGKV